MARIPQYEVKCVNYNGKRKNISLEMFLNIKKKRKLKLTLNPGISTSILTKERNVSLETFLNIKKEKVKLTLNPGIPTSVPTKEDFLQKKPKKETER